MSQSMPPRKIFKTTLKPLLCSYPAAQIDVEDAHAKVLELAHKQGRDGSAFQYTATAVQHAYQAMEKSLAHLGLRIRAGETFRTKDGWIAEPTKDVSPEEAHFILRNDKYSGAWLVSQSFTTPWKPEVQDDFHKRLEAICDALKGEPEREAAIGALLDDTEYDARVSPEKHVRAESPEDVGYIAIRPLRVESGKSKGLPVGHERGLNYLEMKECPHAMEVEEKHSSKLAIQITGGIFRRDARGGIYHHEERRDIYPASSMETFHILSILLAEQGYSDEIREANAKLSDRHYIQVRGAGGELVVDAAISSIHAAGGMVTEDVMRRHTEVIMARRCGSMQIKGDDLKVFASSLRELGHISREKSYYPYRGRFWVEEEGGVLILRGEYEHFDEHKKGKYLGDYKLSLGKRVEFSRVDPVFPGVVAVFDESDGRFSVEGIPHAELRHHAWRAEDFWDAFELLGMGAYFLERGEPVCNSGIKGERMKTHDRFRAEAVAAL